MSRPPEMCPRCNKRALYTEIERDTGLCGYCADSEYERHVARLEWEHYHPANVFARTPAPDGGATEGE